MRLLGQFLLWLAALTLAPSMLLAASVQVGDAAVRALLTPQSGIYYPIHEPGQGIVLEHLGQGRFFGAYLGYDSAGDPTWLSFNGQFSANADAHVLAGGSIGELLATSSTTSDGACFACPYTAPVVSGIGASDIHIEFLTAAQIRVSMGGVTKLMSLPEHTAAFGSPTAGTQHDNPTLRKLTGVWTMRVRQASGGQTVTKQGRVLLFAVPLSAPLGAEERQTEHRFVYGVYCHDPDCDINLMPLLTAGSAPGQSIRPILFWNAAIRSGQLKVFTQADAPSGPWQEQTPAAAGTLMQNGAVLSGLASAQADGAGRQDISFDLTPTSLWFP